MANNMKGESKGYVIANKELLCPICKCDKFYKKNIKLNKNSVYFNNYQKQIKIIKFKIDLKNHNGKDKITLYRN